MEKTYKMLVINPGSTSTKVSYFENEKNIYTESIFHDAPELLRYPTVNDQIPLRRAVIEDFVKKNGHGGHGCLRGAGRQRLSPEGGGHGN